MIVPMIILCILELTVGSYSTAGRFQLCILSLPPKIPECTQIGESVWPITCIVPDSIRLHTGSPSLNALYIEENSNLHCIGPSVMDPAPPDSFYVWYRPSFSLSITTVHVPFDIHNFSLLFPFFPRAFARTLIVTQTFSATGPQNPQQTMRSI